MAKGPICTCTSYSTCTSCLINQSMEELREEGECKDMTAEHFAAMERMKLCHPHLCRGETCTNYISCWDADMGEFGEGCKGELYRKAFKGLCWKCRAKASEGVTGGKK